MPETDDRTLCIRIEKPITMEGYEQNFMPRIRAMVDRHDEIRLLLYFQAYKGWEREAALEDLGMVQQYGPKLVKMALVNPPEKEVFQMKTRKPLTGGEIRFFNESDLAEALAWVKS